MSFFFLLGFFVTFCDFFFLQDFAFFDNCFYNKNVVKTVIAKINKYVKHADLVHV